MNQEHRNALQSSLHHVCQDLDALSALPYLIAKGILREDQAEELEGINRSNVRNRKLISYIRAGGPLAFDEFILCLRIIKQEFLAETILRHLPSTSQDQNSADNAPRDTEGSQVEVKHESSVSALTKFYEEQLMSHEPQRIATPQNSGRGFILGTLKSDEQGSNAISESIALHAVRRGQAHLATLQTTGDEAQPEESSSYATKTAAAASHTSLFITEEISEVFTLKNFYKEQLKSHNPLYMFLDFEFDMDDCYVSLNLQSKASNEDTADLAVFIERAFSEFPFAIVVGDPFSGKTTLLQKIAFDWANNGKFNEYDIVLFSEFRRLPNGNYKSILDVALAGVCKIDLTNISKKRMLLLIDGYDEKRQSQICDQLDFLLNNNNKVNLGFDLLITSRPSSLFKRKKEASFWNTNGFVSDKQRSEYIRKHFRDLPHAAFVLKCSAIESDLEKNYALRELAKSPMMLTFFCLVHDKMKPITKAALFDAVVKFMIQRYDKKHPRQKVLRCLAGNGTTFSAELAESQAAAAVEHWREFPEMRRLGKLAFEATLQKKLEFESNDFGTGDSAINRQATFEGIGLLFKSSEVNGVSMSCKFQFMHRAMQEFFSALYFLYWQNDTIQHVDNLLIGGQINANHRDFVQMTFDVLMAERKEAALISISPLLSEIQSLYLYPTIRLQSQSVDELRKEHAFFQSIMRNCKKITDILIDGMGAAVDFAWTIKLPHDHHGGKILVQLGNFNFVGTNELILSVNCSEHVQLEEFWLIECKFEPERLRLTVDGYLSHLNTVGISLTPEMMEKLSILPDSRFTPSEWSGELQLLFPREHSPALNNDRSIYRLLQTFPCITELYLDNDYSGMHFSPGTYHGSELQNIFKKLDQLKSQFS